MAYTEFTKQDFSNYEYIPDNLECKGHYGKIDVPMRTCLNCKDIRLYDYYDHCCCYPPSKNCVEINDIYFTKYYDNRSKYEDVLMELKYRR